VRPDSAAVSIRQSVARAAISGNRGSQARGSKLGSAQDSRALLRRLPHAVKVPACSTIHAVPDRHGLVSRLTRSRTRAEGAALPPGLSPSDLWCTDYKAEFPLADTRYCYPLTVTDHASRYRYLCVWPGHIGFQTPYSAENASPCGRLLISELGTPGSLAMPVIGTGWPLPTGTPRFGFPVAPGSFAALALTLQPLRSRKRSSPRRRISVQPCSASAPPGIWPAPDRLPRSWIPTLYRAENLRPA
jgi:hypothetical protein